MAKDVLISFIEKELPANGEWWSTDNQKPFMALAVELGLSGYKVPQIKEILQSVYSAVASEYGD